MNNWNFNEVTQADILDFKACKHNETGKIYGIKDGSDCQSGKEITLKDREELAARANKGDKQAIEESKKIVAAEKESDKKEKVKEKEAKAAKQKKELEDKCKAGDKKACKAIGGGKGKGKGKKGGGKAKKSGGGKGKGSKSKGGGGAAKSAASATKRAPQTRQSQIESARKGVKALQDALSTIKNPKQRARIEEKIADLLTQVAQLSMPSSLAQQAQQQPQAPGNQQQKPEKS